MAEAIDQLMVKLGLDVEQEQFQQAESQFSSLQSTALQFGALIGGGLGLKEFTFDFANAISEISRFSDVWEGIEVSPQFVNEMQGVFSLLRDDASQAMPFIENLGKIIEDTDWGNFSEMALAEGFNIAGLQEAETAMEAMTAINEQIRQIAEDDPERARRITQHLGFSDDAGMILRNQDLGAVRQQSRDLRPMTNEMVEAADEFTRGWAELSRAMTSLRDQISVSFVGDLGSGMREMADAIADNREEIENFWDEAKPILTGMAASLTVMATLRASQAGLGILSKIPGATLAAGAVGGIIYDRAEGSDYGTRVSEDFRELREALGISEPESGTGGGPGLEFDRGVPQIPGNDMSALQQLGRDMRRNEFNYEISIDARGARDPAETRRQLEGWTLDLLQEAADNAREDTASEAQ